MHPRELEQTSRREVYKTVVTSEMPLRGRETKKKVGQMKHDVDHIVGCGGVALATFLGPVR